MKRKVIISVPTPEKSEIYSSVSLAESPYQLVETIRPDWRQLPLADYHPHHHISIGEVMPIHNVGGLRDASQITKMVDSIKADQHVLDSGELPNVKLIVAPDGRLLLFDGHHTLIAYYQHGHRQLGEVPHLVISDPDDGPVTVSELVPFFPLSEKEKVLNAWQDYAVNWQQPTAQQLEPRQVFNFAELADAF